MQRRPSLELLDHDAGTPREIEASLRDLQMFNQYFGGVATTRRLVRRIARQTQTHHLSLLEVAAGAGWLPLRIARDLAPDVHVEVTLLDRARSHLNGSRRSVAADAGALPFAADSFDLVCCNLFVHHLAPDELCRFAAEALRVCRLALVINDVIRSPLHLGLAYAGFPLYRSRITRNDAPASVRQAYTSDEVTRLIEPLAHRVEVSHHYLYRMGMIAWKRA